MVASKPSPFLTDDQRAALDAALAAKAAEQLKARASQHHAKNHALNSNRSKATGGKLGGGAKKGGGGGKYTWGSLLDPSAAAAAIDTHDPNYDSEEEAAKQVAGRHGRHGAHAVILRSDPAQRMAAEVQAYKDAVKSLVEEYFASGDVGDVAESLETMGSALGGPAEHLAHYFVKRLVSLALDRKDREREAASALLSGLYAEVLSGATMDKGFMSLVEALDDTVLDVPDAPRLLATFMARAVVDDVLPPAIVSKLPESASPAALDLKAKLEDLLSLRNRHSAEKILRAWSGAGSSSSVTEAKAAIAALLTEFCSSLDAEEARACLHKLAVPFFHHELVKQALVMALDQPARSAQLVGLLAKLSEVGELSASQVAKGVARTRDSLDDLALDNPAAKERYGQLMELVEGAKLLEGVDLPPAPGSSSAAASPANGSHGPGTGASVSAYKAAAIAAIKEYFDSADAAEVAATLDGLAEPGLSHLFVKAALSAAMDRRDRDRELVSTLLARLVPDTVPADQLASGFTRLLASLDDLVLDCPNATRLASLFLARAIVDEVLPPAFLAQAVPHLDASGLGVVVVRSAGTLLSARHGAEQAANCWAHSGSGYGLDAVRAQIRSALEEYLEARDVGEVARLLGELGVGAFHHEVVLAAAEISFERFHAEASSSGSGPAQDAAVEAAAGPLATLLGELHARGVLRGAQMAQGYARVRAALQDEVLDYGPAAREVFAWLETQASTHGWLETGDA